MRKKASDLRVGDRIIDLVSRDVLTVEAIAVLDSAPPSYLISFVGIKQSDRYFHEDTVEVLNNQGNTSIRTKFVVSTISEHYERSMTRVILVPHSLVHSEENRTLWTGTTAGRISLDITTDTAEYFVLGGEYYVDFTRAND